MSGWNVTSPAAIVGLVLVVACSGEGRRAADTTREQDPASVGDGAAPISDASVPVDGMLGDAALNNPLSEASVEDAGPTFTTPEAAAPSEPTDAGSVSVQPDVEAPPVVVACPDADADGHRALPCGGDDCSDDDPSIYPGSADLCDGKDNDCDGAVDGVAAELACNQGLPAGATAGCASGSCAVRCSDPDFDLLGGACVRHDDCSGVSACSPGSCVDGVRAYTCTCPAGYTGSGSTACSDVDECQTASVHGCDTSPAACVNTAGSFRCECPTTHLGEGEGELGCARKVLSVSAGSRHTCAVLAGGKVKCWGSDAFGKLGLGNSSETPRGAAPGQMGDSLPYVDLGARSATSVAAGSDVTCSTLDDGRVQCWGYNGYGAVGGGNPGSFGLTGHYAPLPAGRTSRAVGAGSGYGFAVLDDGTLGRWGQSFSAYVLSPGRTVRSFDRSLRYQGYHLCAVLDTGAVRCWPSDPFARDVGQYGWSFDASLSPESYPATNVGTDRSATAVALGDTHSCALLDRGEVKCWGANDKGQLGLGDVYARGGATEDMGDALRPVALGAPALSLSSGDHHTCALLQGGIVKCWGLNDAGQLGQGHTRNIGDEPGELESLPPVELGSGRTALAIDVGSHSCAVLDDGTLKCWGTNASGELGQGDVMSRGDQPGSMGDALEAIDLGG